MKIVGFSQLRNELEKGNLENWIKCMQTLCDYIYIFDQNSTDGSKEYYKNFNNVVVIESPTNQFSNEARCKQQLLDKIKVDHPDTNFIFWMDGDTLVDGRLLKNDGQPFKDLCLRLSSAMSDAYSFGHKNLWRSDIHERLDNSYNWLDGPGVCALWKFTPNISFDTTRGLHRRNYPITINTYRKCEFSLVHRGFATDYQIMTKYDLYKANGQTGWNLDRLLEESTLKVREINRELLPDWFKVTDDENPINKKKIREIYNETKH